MSRQAHPIKASIRPKDGARRIRTKSVHFAKSDGAKEAETPEIILWAVPRSLFISADLRDTDLDSLQIHVNGTHLIFSGYLHSDLPAEKEAVHQEKNAPVTFNHILELPYEVDNDQTEVQNENGLISIILRRKESLPYSDRITQSTFTKSMQRFLGENGNPPNKLKDEITMLETLERYLEYQSGRCSSER
jgi:HSP20 family molecular chaperone IbpA